MGTDEKLEKWMDEALREYGHADAGPGLEGRIFARVREREEARRTRRGWLRTLSLTAALAAALLASVWLAYRPHANVHSVAQSGSGDRSVQKTETVSPQQALPRSGSRKGKPTRRRVQVARASRSPSRDAQGTVAPKLNQFPAPAPLSEQEQILARYVVEHQQEAVMVAQAQTDLAKRDLLEEQGPKSANLPKRSDHTR